MANAPARKLTPLALLVLCGTIFLSVTNSSMTSVALPDVQKDFHVAADDLSWVVTAYLIPFATGTIVYGRLGDIYGTKKLYMIGLVLFAGASLASAAAPSFGSLVALRALAGLGGTAIPSLSMATIIRTTTPLERGRAMGATILAVGVGFGLGPLAGGLFTGMLGWHGPFLLTGIGTAAFLPVAIAAVPGVPGGSREGFDVPGVVLVAGAVTGTIIALNRLPSDAASTLGLSGLAVAVALWPLAAWRVAAARAPFVSRVVARNGRFWMFAVIGMAAQGGHFAVVVLIPLLLAGYHGMGTIAIGLVLVPGATAIGAFGMAGGVLLNRLGARLLIAGGTVLILAASLVLQGAGAGWEPWAIAAVYAAFAAGYGMINASVIHAATGQVAEELAGVAVGLFNLCFFMGGAVSVALAGAILRSRSGEGEALVPWYGGRAPEFSDALLVVLVYAVAGVALALLGTRPRREAGGEARAIASTPVHRGDVEGS